MKGTFKHKITRIRRYFKVKIGRVFRSGNSYVRVMKPKKMSEGEKNACDIFLILLHDKDSKLYYDVTTQECYISSKDMTVFIILESRNIKIINSVFGYDVPISQELEHFMSEKFIREMAIRRNIFKKEILSKINHSLELTLKKVKNEKAN